MIELFDNIRQEVKDTAETAWTLTMAQKNPIEASKLLNQITEYYKLIWTEEEVEFLQFYFQMKMEMMKE